MLGIKEACDSSMPYKRRWQGRTTSLLVVRGNCELPQKMPLPEKKSSTHQEQTGGYGTLCSAQACQEVIDSLFPAHPVQRHHMVVVDPASIPTFTEENLKNAVALMKNGKAPGPDGIPVEAIKKASTHRTSELLRVYNACLKNGVFPKQWKVARLFLLSKGKADPTVLHHFDHYACWIWEGNCWRDY
ncbi:hypothetical protein LSTR_LSTR015406 [Laodelphax striatellus]|uniref:Reverse transcriptase domain-containing protein n=1 Tax=Laodelphax striatellus TaxID=195883 RepID=A0A482WJC1_LAOST|nr:hypothetical protein LSTR_LSTR015406 [Laodelphax striatellus]